MVWKLRDQPGEREKAQHRDADVAIDRLEAVEQRFERTAEVVRTNACDRRVQQHNHEGRDDERQHAKDDALGHVALGIDRFFRRQRQLLDGEEQPDREGQGSPACPRCPCGN